MITKCIRGDYFPGLIDYIMRQGQYAVSDEKPRVLECEGLFSPITSAAELAQQASLAPSRTKRAVHLLGRAEKGLTDEQFREAGRRILAAAGLSGRPFLLVVHDDDGHFHLATVEVDESGHPPPRRLVSCSLKREVTVEEAARLPPGDVASRSWDSHLAWRLTKVSRELEVEFDLRRLGNNRDTYDSVRIPTWQLKREDELGIVPLAKALPDEMKAALDLPTWEKRNEALAMLGLGIRAYEGANKTRRGLQIYALGDPDHFCNGSQLGKAYGLATIDKRSDQPLEAWLRFRSENPRETVEAAAVQHTVKVSSKSNNNEDQALIRLRAEYAGYRARHRAGRDQRRGMSKRLASARRKDRAVVGSLREQLLATGRVSKSWARIICQAARAELKAKTAARHLREKAELATLPKRRLTWTQFLAEAAARDRGAIRIHEQARRRADEEQKARERASASKQAAARESERRKALEQAAAAEAASERAAAELAERICEAEEKRARDRRKELLTELEAKLIVWVRIASPDDHATVLAFLRDRPEHRAAFTDVSLASDVTTMMKNVHGVQQTRLGEALKFIGSVDDLEMFKGSGVDFDKVEDPRSRSALTVTFGWPEIAEAIQARRQLLAREVGVEAKPSAQEIPEAREAQAPAHPDSGVSEILQQQQIARSPASQIDAGHDEDRTRAPVPSAPAIVASADANQPPSHKQPRDSAAPIPTNAPAVARECQETAAKGAAAGEKSITTSLRASSEPDRQGGPPKHEKMASVDHNVEKAKLADKFFDKKAKRERNRLDGGIRDSVRERAGERANNPVLAVDERQSISQHKARLPIGDSQAAAANSAETKTDEMPLPAHEIEPEYIRVDREFVEGEIAEGREIGSKRLKIWREQMTCADTPFYRSDGDVIGLAVENEPDWAEAVKEAMNSSMADDQIVRYLTLMVPLLPPASRCEGQTVTFPIISHENEALAQAYLNAALQAQAAER